MVCMLICWPQQNVFCLKYVWFQQNKEVFCINTLTPTYMFCPKYVLYRIFWHTWQLPQASHLRSSMSTMVTGFWGATSPTCSRFFLINLATARPWAPGKYIRRRREAPGNTYGGGEKPREIHTGEERQEWGGGGGGRERVAQVIYYGQGKCGVEWMCVCAVCTA